MVNCPAALGKAKLSDGLFIFLQHYRIRVHEGDGDGLVSCSDHIQIDLVAGQGIPSPVHFVTRTVQAIILAHTGCEGFFPVKKDELHLRGLFRRGAEYSGQLQHSGGSTGAIIRTNEVRSYADFGINVAGDDNRAGGFLFTKGSMKICHAYSIGEGEASWRHLPTGSSKVFLEVFQLGLIGRRAARAGPERTDVMAVNEGIFSVEHSRLLENTSIWQADSWLICGYRW